MVAAAAMEKCRQSGLCSTDQSHRYWCNSAKMAAFTGSETSEVCSAPSGAPALAAAGNSMDEHEIAVLHFQRYSTVSGKNRRYTIQLLELK